MPVRVMLHTGLQLREQEKACSKHAGKKIALLCYNYIRQTKRLMYNPEGNSLFFFILKLSKFPLNLSEETLKLSGKQNNVQ